MFVIAMRVARSILECVYCCRRAKLVSAVGVHKTQPKVPILHYTRPIPIPILQPNDAVSTPYCLCWGYTMQPILGPKPNYVGSARTSVLVYKTEGFNGWATKPNHAAKVC